MEDTQPKKRFGTPGNSGETHTVSTQKATDSFDLDGAADDPTLRGVGLADRHRKLGFELVTKSRKRLGG